MGRILMFGGAALLAVTALIHAAGQPMVDRWVQNMGERQAAALCLVWLTDSLSWAVVAAIWARAGWKPQREWLAAASVAATIPAVTAAGMAPIDPSFFGLWLLVGSVVLAGGGVLFLWRKQQHVSRPIDSEGRVAGQEQK